MQAGGRRFEPVRLHLSDLLWLGRWGFGLAFGRCGVSQRSSRFDGSSSGMLGIQVLIRRWWPGCVSGLGRMVFVSVNQVLVRLWARLQVQGLTDRSVFRDRLF